MSDSSIKKSKSSEKPKSVIYKIEDLPRLWEELPLYINIEDASIFAHSPPVHDYISMLLGTGLTDETGEQRYFLTANEILEKVNVNHEDPEKPMKLSMLYYHLEKLQEQNVVDYIYAQDGQYKRKYFHKTAKILMLSSLEEDERTQMENTLKPILQLMKYYNIEITEKELQQIKDDMYKKRATLRDKRITWIEKDRNLVANPDLDLINVFNYFAIYLTNYASTRKLFDLLAPHVDFLEDY